MWLMIIKLFKLFKIASDRWDPRGIRWSYATKNGEVPSGFLNKMPQITPILGNILSLQWKQGSCYPLENKEMGASPMPIGIQIASPEAPKGLPEATKQKCQVKITKKTGMSRPKRAPPNECRVTGSEAQSPPLESRRIRTGQTSKNQLPFRLLLLLISQVTLARPMPMHKNHR